MQQVRAERDDPEEDQRRVGQQRIAADIEQAVVGQVQEPRRAHAERAALHDGLRDAADQQHAAQRDDERLQLEPRDQQALPQPHQQRDRERQHDAQAQRKPQAAGRVR